MSPASASSVVQGSFLGGRPQVPGVLQRSPQGYAMQLPDSVLRSRRGAGQQIPPNVREKMERALGGDFADVRIHVGPEASSIGALAFAHGSDIFFATGQYNPSTVQGQRLLGHELAHVLQQRAGRVRNPYGSGVAVVQDPGLEAEADRLGLMAATQPKMAGAPALREPAPHVRAALGGGAQPKAVPAAPAAPSAPAGSGPAPHVQAAMQAVAGAHAAPSRNPAAQPRSQGYRVVVGTYLHQGEGAASLPEEVAGHTFISVQSPGGRAETWGFSPAGFNPETAQREMGRMRAGVQGKLHRDDNAFAKPGVKLRTYEVSREQAQAAMAKIDEYRSRRYSFNIEQRQCSTFALDVARAARVDPFPGARLKRPRDIYRQI